jgi:methylenetetrahydrofolate--tRNA-(uracil-5-)-methyltransferase
MNLPEQTEALVIGGGFAGVEAAWALAEAGVRVALAEMRPVRMTPAHKTGDLAELVCSNSFKSEAPAAAAHLLKEEMRRLGSLVMQAAEIAKVPAGAALAVDRDIFSRAVTDRVEAHPNITIVRDEVPEVPEGIPAVIATGPLTSESLGASIANLTGDEYLYFYDAIAPTLEAESIDMDKVFHASRYDKGDGGYLNSPMTQEEYYAFYDALMGAERSGGHDFEKLYLFEGCMPLEEMAARGRETLTFGPLKPVGLIDPRTGKRAYATAQLRQENMAGTLYGLVGFQTRLKWGEQKRVFRMLPGLENAEFVRYGGMHRNTYINAPRVLDATLRYAPDKIRPAVEGDLLGILPADEKQDKGAPAARPHAAPLYFAGQLVGVEGYVESAATGIVAGRNLAAHLRGQDLPALPPDTMLGALCWYVAWSDAKHFQPMNACFGILPPSGMRAKKLERHAAMVQRGLRSLDAWLAKTPQPVKETMR